MAAIFFYGFLLGLVTRVVQVLSYYYAGEIVAPYA